MTGTKFNRVQNPKLWVGLEVATTAAATACVFRGRSCLPTATSLSAPHNPLTAVGTQCASCNELGHHVITIISMCRAGRPQAAIGEEEACNLTTVSATCSTGSSMMGRPVMRGHRLPCQWPANPSTITSPALLMLANMPSVCTSVSKLIKCVVVG